MSPFPPRHAPVLPGPPAELRPGETRPDVDAYAWNPQEALIALNAASRQLLDAHERMAEHLSNLERPAAMETVVLTPTQNVVESQVSQQFRSLSVLNPNTINVYFSLVGSAGALKRSLSCPPNSLLTVPVGSNFVEVAAEVADLGANNAVCYLFRHETVQPAFLGKGGP